MNSKAVTEERISYLVQNHLQMLVFSIGRHPGRLQCGSYDAVKFIWSLHNFKFAGIDALLVQDIVQELRHGGELGLERFPFEPMFVVRFENISGRQVLPCQESGTERLSDFVEDVRCTPRTGGFDSLLVGSKDAVIPYGFPQLAVVVE
jgi:hypothetical protein